MKKDSNQANTQLDHVRRLVTRTLCEQENLEPECFGLGERALMQQGRQYGYYFWLEGPRNVRLSAVWEVNAGAVLCYGADGTRFASFRVNSGEPRRAEAPGPNLRAA